MVAYMLSSTMLCLREHRERLGLTLRRLGEISGVHYVAVARLEAGKLDPRLSTLLKLCKALGVTLDGLVNQRKHKGAR
jgi:transcriptional regulator with XRE-family HTH domain